MKYNFLFRVRNFAKLVASKSRSRRWAGHVAYTEIREISMGF
jgi:hypothetical protein